MVVAGWDDFCTANWIDMIEYPELLLQQTHVLLAAKEFGPIFN